MNAPDDVKAVLGMTADTVGKDLLTALLQEIRLLPDVWVKLPKGKQEDIIDRLRDRVTSNVRMAVHLMASQGRTVVVGDLEQITIKNGTKAVIKIGRGAESLHELYDAQGKAVLIVVADAGDHTGGMDEIHGEADQRGLDLGHEYHDNDGGGMDKDENDRGTTIDGEVPRLPAPSDTGPTAEERNQGSIQEAVRHALTGESVRVALKKDYQKLVTDGAEVGYAVVDHDGERSAITLPNGTHEHTGDGRPPAAVSFCREQLHAVIRSLEDAERIASEADFQTERAAVLHKDIQQWDRIGSALAPDGIPGELLAEALGPINERLARSSSIADWLRIGIQADMTIAADGGRPCHDCKHFVAWLDKEPAPRIDCPGDYNPCTKGHMKFMAPEHYGDDYGFYLRVCHDRELLEAEE